MNDKIFEIAKQTAIQLGKRELEKLQQKVTAPFTNYAKDVQTYYRQSVEPYFTEIGKGIERGKKPETQPTPTEWRSPLSQYSERVTRPFIQGTIGIQELTPSATNAIRLSKEQDLQNKLGRTLNEEEKIKLGEEVYGPLYKDRNALASFDVLNQGLVQPVYDRFKLELANIINPGAIGGYDNYKELRQGTVTGKRELTLNDVFGTNEKSNPIVYQVNRFIDFIPELLAPTGGSAIIKGASKAGLLGKGAKEGGEVLAFAGPKISPESLEKIAMNSSDIAKFVDSFKAQGGELTKQAEDFIRNRFRTAEDINKYVNEQSSLKTSIDQNVGDLNKYIDDQVKRSQPAKEGIAQRAGGIVDWYVKNFEDSINPLSKLINQAVKGGLKLTEKNDVLAQIEKVKRSRQIADTFMTENGLTDLIQGIDSWKNYLRFGEYLKAKRFLEEFKNAPEGTDYNKLSGRDLAKDQNIVSQYSEAFEAKSQEFREYFRKLAGVLKESSLISEKQYQGLIEKVDYAPVQRVFEEVENVTAGMKPSALASISKEGVIKRFIGSTRGVVHPVESAIDMTYRIIREAEVNKASRMIVDMVKEGIIPGTVARDADKVLQRIALAGEIKTYVKQINKIVRTITTRKGWARKLQTEVNRLNKKGYDIFAKRTGEPDKYVDELAQARITKLYNSKDRWFEVLLQDIYSDVSPLIDNFAREFFDKNVTPAQKKEFIKNLTKEQLNDLITPLVNMPYGQYKRFYNKVLKKNEKLDELAQELQNLRDGRELNQVVNNLINRDPEELQNIRSLLDKKTPILNKLVDEITTLTDNLQQNKDYVKSLREESRELKDLDTKFEGTISGLKDGIKETVIMDRNVTDAVKGLSVEKLNTLNKILRSSIRVAKFAFTGGNVPFVIADMIRNDWQTVLFSKRGLRDSIVNPLNLFGSLFDMVGKSDIYMDFLREGGGDTIVSAGKIEEQTVKKIMSGKNLLTKTGYIIKNPQEWFSMIEDSLASPQKLQKFNFYKMYRKQLEREGYSPADANYIAISKTRDALTNFYRSGDIGKVLDTVFVYFNAGIQGAVSLRRLALQDPKKFAIGFTTTLAIPEIVSTLYNISTPERKEAYDKIPEGDKERNFIILPETPIYNEKGEPFFWAVPKPLGLNNLINPVRKFTLGSYNYDAKTAMDIFNELTGAFTGFKAPSQDGGVNPLASQTVPWLTRGLVETAINKNLYTGREIEDADMRRLPVSERVETNTSFTSRQIAKGLQDAGIEISPLMVDNFINSQFGAVGRQVQNKLDTGAVALGLAPEEQIGGKEIGQSISEVIYRARGGEDIRKLSKQQQLEAQQLALQKLQLQRALSSNDIATANNLIPNLTKTEFNNLVDSMQKDVIRDQMTNMQKYLFNRSEAELKKIELSNPELANDIKFVREAKEVVKNTTLPSVDQLELNFRPSGTGGAKMSTTAKKISIKGGTGRRKTSIAKAKAPKLKGVKVKKSKLAKMKQPKFKPIKIKRNV